MHHSVHFAQVSESNPSRIGPSIKPLLKRVILMPKCPGCLTEIDGERFSVELHDESESTLHHNQVNLCADCWGDVLDTVYGGIE